MMLGGCAYSALYLYLCRSFSRPINQSGYCQISKNGTELEYFKFQVFKFKSRSLLWPGLRVTQAGTGIRHRDWQDGIKYTFSLYYYKPLQTWDELFR